MKQVFVIMAALALLLTACGADVPADSETPSATEAQTVATETAAPSEMPGSESTAPVEPSELESWSPTEASTPESSAPAETAAPTSMVPTQTPAPANTAPAITSSPAPTETYAPTSSAPETAPHPESSAPAQTPEPTEPIKGSNTMTITINGQVFYATLYDNETTTALKSKLPMTLSMSELNGNEKYNYLPFSLPTNAGNPGQIHAGDLMLYGSDCLVLFYESFSTSYRYTPIGRINDPSGLADAVGGGGVQVTFTLG